jgi:hypothetical protein
MDGVPAVIQQIITSGAQPAGVAPGFVAPGFVTHGKISCGPMPPVARTMRWATKI